MVRNRFRTSPTLSDPGHPPVCEGLCVAPSHSARGFLVARLAGISPPLSPFARFPRLVALRHLRSPRSSLVARRLASSLHLHRATRELGARLIPCSSFASFVARHSACKHDCHSSLRRSPRSPPSPLVRSPLIARPPPRLPRSSPVASCSSLVSRCSSLE